MVSYVLLNIYYILWKKAKRGVSLFLDDLFVCLLCVEFNLLLVHCRKKIHPRWGSVVYYHFRSNTLVFILSSKFWHLKTSSQLDNRNFSLFISKLLSDYHKKAVDYFVSLSDFCFEVFNVCILLQA